MCRITPTLHCPRGGVFDAGGPGGGREQSPAHSTDHLVSTAEATALHHGDTPTCPPSEVRVNKNTELVQEDFQVWGTKQFPAVLQTPKPRNLTLEVQPEQHRQGGGLGSQPKMWGSAGQDDSPQNRNATAAARGDSAAHGPERPEHILIQPRSATSEPGGAEPGMTAREGQGEAREESPD